MSIDYKPVANALRNVAEQLAVIEVTDIDDVDRLHDAAELIHVLAQLMDGENMVDAFGTPDEWPHNEQLSAAIQRMRDTAKAGYHAPRRSYRKLTDEQVREIRQRGETGGANRAQLAAEFDVHPSTIRDIWNYTLRASA